jgi:hypothetical protein
MKYAKYEIEKPKREKRKREKEIEEAMLIGFLAGNMSGVYRMEAAAHAAGAYD